jgi:hypothetical protein
VRLCTNPAGLVEFHAEIAILTRAHGAIPFSRSAATTKRVSSLRHPKVREWQGLLIRQVQHIGLQQRRLTLGRVIRGNLKEMRLEASEGSGQSAPRDRRRWP